MLTAVLLEVILEILSSVTCSIVPYSPMASFHSLDAQCLLSSCFGFFF